MYLVSSVVLPSKLALGHIASSGMGVLDILRRSAAMATHSINAEVSR